MRSPIQTVKDYIKSNLCTNQMEMGIKSNFFGVRLISCNKIFKMLELAVLCLLACATLPFGAGLELERISGGLPSNRGQFPFFVSIRAPDYGHVCGGAIINQRHILTIASCTNDSYVAFVGAHTRNDGIPYTIRTTIRHPGYNPRFANNDIAVLATHNVIQFNQFVSSIPLPQRSIPASNVASMLIGLGDVGVREC